MHIIRKKVSRDREKKGILLWCFFGDVARSRKSREIRDHTQTHIRVDTHAILFMTSRQMSILQFKNIILISIFFII